MGVLVNPLGWRVGSNLLWKTNFYIDSYNYKKLINKQVVQYLVLQRILNKLNKHYYLRRWLRVIDQSIYLQNKKLFVFIKINFNKKKIWKLLFKKRGWFWYVRMLGALQAYKKFKKGKASVGIKRKYGLYLLNKNYRLKRDIIYIEKNLELFTTAEKKKLFRVLKNLNFKRAQTLRNILKLKRKLYLLKYAFKFKYKWGRNYRVLRFLKKKKKIMWFFFLLKRTKRLRNNSRKKLYFLPKKKDSLRFFRYRKFYYLKRRIRNLDTRLDVIGLWEREKRALLKRARREAKMRIKIFKKQQKLKRRRVRIRAKKLLKKHRYYLNLKNKQKRKTKLFKLNRYLQKSEDLIKQIESWKFFLSKLKPSDYSFKKIAGLGEKARKIIEIARGLHPKIRRRWRNFRTRKFNRKLQNIKIRKFWDSIYRSGGRSRILRHIARFHNKTSLYADKFVQFKAKKRNRQHFMGKLQKRYKGKATHLPRNWVDPACFDQRRTNPYLYKIKARPLRFIRGKRKAEYTTPDSHQKKKLQKFLLSFFKILPLLLEFKRLVLKALYKFFPQLHCRVYLLNVTKYSCITAKYILEHVEKVFKRSKRTTKFKRTFYRFVRLLIIIKKKFKLKGFKLLIAGRFARRNRAVYIWKTRGAIPMSTKFTKVDFAIRKMQMKYSKPVAKLWICHM